MVLLQESATMKPIYPLIVVLTHGNWKGLKTFIETIIWDGLSLQKDCAGHN